MYIIFLFLFLCVTSTISQVTLDDVLSFPTRQNLVSGSDGACSNAIAWIELTRGVNNIWMVPNTHTTPNKPIQITHFITDNGGEMLSLKLFNNNNNCVPIFILGPTAGANPNHDIQPPSYGTWLPEDSTIFPPNMVCVIDEMYQSISPDGNNILYTTNGDVGISSTRVEFYSIINTHRYPLFAVKQGTISVDEWVMINNQNVCLFSNNRGDHGFVGMYVQNTTQIIWLSASVDTDINPRLSPDGTKIAFVRLLGTQQEGLRGLGGHRGPNFQVWILELNAIVPGTAKMIYENKDGWPDGGSGYGVRNMEWLDKSTLFFGSESSGWLHPVVLDVLDVTHLSSATKVMDIFGTNQKCEAKSWYIKNNIAWIVHNNCNGNLDTRSISKYSTGDATAQNVIQGNTTCGYGMSSSGYGLTTVTSATSTTADSLIYITTSVNQATSIESTDLGTFTKSWKLPIYTTPESITFPSSDHAKYTIHAQLFSTSKNRTSKGTVIFTHGGSQRQMFPYFHFGPCYGALYALNQYIATVLGYDVLSVNYRSGIGYGKSFRVCQECMWLGGKEYIDVLQGANWLKSNYPTNTKIGIHGLSYGGLNVLQAMSRNPETFAVGVANAPVYNWITQNRYDREIFLDVEPKLNNGFNSLPIGPDSNQASPMWLEQIVPDAQKLAWLSSPASHVQNLTGPTLLIQGDADNEVAFSESIGLVRAVRKLGRNNVVSKVFPDETHGLARYATQLEAAMLTVEFLKMHLE